MIQSFSDPETERLFRTEWSRRFSAVARVALRCPRAAALLRAEPRQALEKPDACASRRLREVRAAAAEESRPPQIAHVGQVTLPSSELRLKRGRETKKGSVLFSCISARCQVAAARSAARHRTSLSAGENPNYGTRTSTRPLILWSRLIRAAIHFRRIVTVRALGE